MQHFFTYCKGAKGSEEPLHWFSRGTLCILRHQHFNQVLKWSMEGVCRQSDQVLLKFDLDRYHKEAMLQNYACASYFGITK